MTPLIYSTVTAPTLSCGWGWHPSIRKPRRCQTEIARGRAEAFVEAHPNRLRLPETMVVQELVDKFRVGQLTARAILAEARYLAECVA